MTYAVYTTATGALVSVGSVVADPLPAGLAVVELTDDQAADLGTGKGLWDPATLSVVPNPDWVDPAIAEGNKSAIETNLEADLVLMQAILDDTNANINSNPAARIKEMCRMLKRLGRTALNDYSEAE